MNTPLALVEPPSEAVSAQQDAPQGDLEPKRHLYRPSVHDSTSDRHRRVARMIGFGFCDDTIAEACDMHPRAVWDMRLRPEVQAYVARLKDLARLEVLERKDQFDGLLQKSIEAYGEILTDTNTTPHLRFKVACEIMDRHPDGQFVRGRTTTTYQAPPVVDSEAIKRLKEIAAKTNAEAINASGSAPIHGQTS